MKVGALSIARLCREYWEKTEEKADDGLMKWFSEGADESFDYFRSFNVN